MAVEISLEPVLYPFETEILLVLVSHIVVAWASVMSMFEEHWKCLVGLRLVSPAEAFAELQLDVMVEAVDTVCSI